MDATAGRSAEGAKSASYLPFTATEPSPRLTFKSRRGWPTSLTFASGCGERASKEGGKRGADADPVGVQRRKVYEKKSVGLKEEEQEGDHWTRGN